MATAHQTLRGRPALAGCKGLAAWIAALKSIRGALSWRVWVMQYRLEELRQAARRWWEG